MYCDKLFFLYLILCGIDDDFLLGSDSDGMHRRAVFSTCIEPEFDHYVVKSSCKHFVNPLVFLQMVFNGKYNSSNINKKSKPQYKLDNAKRGIPSQGAKVDHHM